MQSFVVFTVEWFFEAHNYKCSFNVASLWSLRFAINLLFSGTLQETVKACYLKPHFFKCGRKINQSVLSFYLFIFFFRKVLSKMLRVKTLERIGIRIANFMLEDYPCWQPLKQNSHASSWHEHFVSYPTWHDVGYFMTCFYGWVWKYHKSVAILDNTMIKVNILAYSGCQVSSHF